MSISFDPTQRTTQSSLPHNQTARVSRSGVSATPSSIDSRLSAQTSAEGCCSGIPDCIQYIGNWISNCIQCIGNWISNCIQYIGHIFSPATRPAAAPPAAAVAPVGPASTLDQRLRLANSALDRHFSWERIDQANHANSAMITIMNYNGHSRVVFGKTPLQRTQVVGAKSTMYALLSNADMSPGDGGVLKIVTLLIDGNANRQHTISTIHQFRGNPEPPREVETSSSINPDGLAARLNEDVSSAAQRQLVVNFLRTFVT